MPFLAVRFFQNGKAIVITFLHESLPPVISRSADRILLILVSKCSPRRGIGCIINEMGRAMKKIFKKFEQNFRFFARHKNIFIFFVPPAMGLRPLFHPR